MKLTNPQLAILNLLLHGFSITSVPWADNPPYIYWKMVCEYLPNCRITSLRALSRHGLIDFYYNGDREIIYRLTESGKKEAIRLEF